MPDELYGIVGSPNKTPSSGVIPAKSGFTIGNQTEPNKHVLGQEFTDDQRGSVEQYKDYFNPNTPINFFNPDSMRETRAQNQNGWNLFGNSIGRVVGSELVGGTISGFGTLLDPRAWAQIVTHSASAFEGNFLNELGNAIREKTDEALPIYLTENAEKGFAFDKTWFWNMFPTVASTATALIPTMAVSKLASTMAKSMKIATKLTKTGAATTEILANSLMSRHIDGFQSSAQTYQQQYNHYKELGYDEDKAREAASDEAAKAYRYGYANLVFDIIEWKFLLGSKGITAGNIDAATAKALLDKKLITNNGFTNLLSKFEKPPSIGTTLAATMFSEGSDEMLMDFVQKEGIRSSSVIEDRTNDKTSILGRLGHHIATDRNTWDSFLWGAVGGVGMVGIHHVTNKLLNGKDNDNSLKQLAAITDRSDKIKSQMSAITTMIKNGDTVNAKVAQTHMISDIMDNAVQDGGLEAYRELIDNMATIDDAGAAEYNVSKEDRETAKAVKPELEAAIKIYNKYYNKNYTSDKVNNSIIGINLSRLNYMHEKLNGMIDELNTTGKDKETEIAELKSKFGLSDEFNTDDLLDLANPNREDLLLKSIGNANKASYVDSVVRERELDNKISVNNFNLAIAKHTHAAAIEIKNAETEEVGKALADRKIDLAAKTVSEHTELAATYAKQLALIKSDRTNLTKGITAEELTNITDMTNAIVGHLDNTQEETVAFLVNQKDKVKQNIDKWNDVKTRDGILKGIHTEHDAAVKKETDAVNEEISNATTSEELDIIDKKYASKYTKAITAKRKLLDKAALRKKEHTEQILKRIMSIPMEAYNHNTLSDTDIHNAIIKKMIDEVTNNPDGVFTDRVIDIMYAKYKREIVDNIIEPIALNDIDNTKPTDTTDDTTNADITRAKTIKARVEQIKNNPAELLKEIEMFNKVYESVAKQYNNANIPAEEKEILGGIIDTMKVIQESLNTVGTLLNKQELTDVEVKFIYKTIAFNNTYARSINKIFGAVTNKAQLDLLRKLNTTTNNLGSLATVALNILHSVKDIQTVTMDAVEQKYYNNFILALNVFIGKNSESLDEVDEKWKADLINTTENALKVMNAAVQYIEHLTKTPIRNITYDDILRVVYQTTTPSEFISIAKGLKQVFTIIESTKQNTNNKNIPKLFSKVTTTVNYELNNPNFISDWKEKNYPKDTPETIEYRVETKSGMSIYLHDLKLMNIPESGEVSPEVAAIINEFYGIAEGTELVLTIDTEHEDERHEDKAARNTDPTLVPIAIKTKNGTRIGFTNETYATHHNIVYFKKNANGKLEFHSFVDSMTNNDFDVLQQPDVLVILREMWVKDNFKNYDNLSKTNILKQTINKLIYVNRIDDNIEPTHDQIKHIIAPIFYRVSNRVVNNYEPTTSMLKEKYKAFNTRMRTDFELVKELREDYAKTGVMNKTVKVTNVSTGELKHHNQMNNIATEIPKINGKLTIATVNNRRAGDGVTLYPAGKINANSPFTNNRPIKVINQATLSPESGSKVSETKNSFVIVEANKGRYYAIPIYQATLDNSQHTGDKEYQKKLVNYITAQTEQLLTINDKAKRDEIWKNLAKYIRLANKNSPNDTSFILYYRPDNTENSNVVFTTYENENGIGYTTYYKFENSSEGTYKVYRSQSLNANGKPKFSRDTYTKYNSKAEFIAAAKPIMATLKRNTTFASYDELKQALKLKEDDGTFYDNVNDKMYIDNEDYNAYERFLINTGAYVTNTIGIKSRDKVISSFFPNGSPKATLFIDTKDSKPIPTPSVPKQPTQTPKSTSDNITTIAKFIEDNKTTVNFENLTFLFDILKQLNITLEINNQLSVTKDSNGKLVHATVNNNVISLYAGFLFMNSKQGELDRSPTERGLILAHEILHSVFDNIQDRLSEAQLVEYRAKIENYKKDLGMYVNDPKLTAAEQSVLKQYIAKIDSEPDEAFTYAFSSPGIAAILNKIEGEDSTGKKNFLYRLIEIITNALGINHNSQLMAIYNIASQYITDEIDNNNTNETVATEETKITEEVVPPSKKGRYAKRNKDATVNPTDNPNNKPIIDIDKYSLQIDYNNSEQIIANYTSQSGLKLC